MTIAVAEYGQGSAVVLIHGAPSAPSHFDSLREHLARDHRVLVPTLPGYGKSERLIPYSISGVREQLVTVLRDRGITRAALVGFSAGGYHAMALAASGGGFDATVVVGIGALAFMAPEDAPAYRRLADVIRPMRDFSDRAFRDMFASRMLSEPWRSSHPADGARVATWLDATTPAVLADELEAFASAVDLRPALARLEIPIVARVGEHDPAAPPSVAEAIVASCRHGELQVVRGCGHALLIEDEVATIAAIRTAITGSEALVTAH